MTAYDSLCQLMTANDSFCQLLTATLSEQLTRTLQCLFKIKLRFQYLYISQLIRPDGLLVLGQDQDNVGGGYDRYKISEERKMGNSGCFRRQSFSGLISQFNIWNASLEDFHIENMAECRSDAFGNSFAWKESLYSLGDEYSEVIDKYLHIHIQNINPTLI